MTEIPSTRVSLLVRLGDPQDEAAWTQFVDLYAPLVYGYARKQGLQDADAADLAQDVLLSVAGAVGKLEYDPARGSFRSWLFTIVRRKLSNRRRSQRTRRDAVNGASMDRFLVELPAPAREQDQWEAEWERGLFAWACEQVRMDVTATSWQAFWRTAVDGQPGKQVARDLGLSVAAVYHARSRILARLKEFVKVVEEC
jgi:RNA polymerase sigma-70 factor (ECF subfamily)